jgi:hypothetical protein
MEGWEILGRLACVCVCVGGGGGLEWIKVAQFGDQWQALMNTVMNLWVLAPRS